jgi:peptidylprolyl isomerase
MTEKRPNWTTRIIGVAVFLFVALFGVLVYFNRSAPPPPPPPGPAPYLMMQLEDGPVVIRLRPDLAPKHVARMVELTERGFYDGLVFHRVIDDFMAQTGDPTGTGRGGSDLPDVEAEFGGPFVRGTVGGARSGDPDSFNSQFFIVTGDASYLDNQYTVIGQVESGMEFVDMIKKGDPSDNGMVTAPDKIVGMKVEYR